MIQLADMKKCVILLFAILFTGYVVYEGRGLIVAPPLALWSPAQDIVTDEKYIIIEGKTAPGAQVAVNGSQILPAADGYFRERIALQDGINTLQVTASKRHSRMRIIERTILVSRVAAALSTHKKKGASGT